MTARKKVVTTAVLLAVREYYLGHLTINARMNNDLLLRLIRLQ